MRIKFFDALGFLFLGVGLGMLLSAPADPAPEMVAPAQLDRIEEDSPFWDCLTMGNQTCGTGRAA